MDEQVFDTVNAINNNVVNSIEELKDQKILEKNLEKKLEKNVEKIEKSVENDLENNFEKSEQSLLNENKKNGQLDLENFGDSLIEDLHNKNEDLFANLEQNFDFSIQKQFENKTMNLENLLHEEFSDLNQTKQLEAMTLNIIDQFTNNQDQLDLKENSSCVLDQKIEDVKNISKNIEEELKCSFKNENFVDETLDIKDLNFDENKKDGFIEKEDFCLNENKNQDLSMEENKKQDFSMEENKNEDFSMEENKQKSFVVDEINYDDKINGQKNNDQSKDEQSFISFDNQESLVFENPNQIKSNEFCENKVNTLDTMSQEEKFKNFIPESDNFSNQEFFKTSINQNFSPDSLDQNNVSDFFKNELQGDFNNDEKNLEQVNNKITFSDKITENDFLTEKSDIVVSPENNKMTLDNFVEEKNLDTSFETTSEKLKKIIEDENEIINVDEIKATTENEIKIATVNEHESTIEIEHKDTTENKILCEDEHKIPCEDEHKIPCEDETKNFINKEIDQACEIKKNNSSSNLINFEEISNKATEKNEKLNESVNQIVTDFVEKCEIKENLKEKDISENTIDKLKDLKSEEDSQIKNLESYEIISKIEKSNETKDLLSEEKDDLENKEKLQEINNFANNVVVENSVLIEEQVSDNKKVEESIKVLAESGLDNENNLPKEENNISQNLENVLEQSIPLDNSTDKSQELEKSKTAVLNEENQFCKKCVFCKIIQKEKKADILFENETTIVFKDISPVAKTHFLVIPKKHINNVKSLNIKDLGLVENLKDIALDVLKTLNVAFTEDNLRLGFHWPPFNSISHIHLHVITPISDLSWKNKLSFRPNSYWFITHKSLVEYIKKKEN